MLKELSEAAKAEVRFLCLEGADEKRLAGLIEDVSDATITANRNLPLKKIRRRVQTCRQFLEKYREGHKQGNRWLNESYQDLMGALEAYYNLIQSRWHPGRTKRSKKSLPHPEGRSRQKELAAAALFRLTDYVHFSTEHYYERRVAVILNDVASELSNGGKWNEKSLRTRRERWQKEAADEPDSVIPRARLRSINKKGR